MTPQKRLADVLFALFLVVVLAPLAGVIALAILLLDGRPVLFASPRVHAPGRLFPLLKFRTMTNDPADAGVSGGHKTHRITRTGKLLRATRFDELPQLINVLRGDISFVGPRPPLPVYVDRFPELYADVLKSRPGITGLATLAFHKREEALLAACSSAEETEAVYMRRCVPVKARLDLIYAKNHTFCFDAWLILATAFRRLPVVLKN